MKQQYFLSKDGPELVDDALGIINRWNSAVLASGGGISAVWERNIRSYYSTLSGGMGSDSALGFLGDQGEIVEMLVPQARSLNTQLLTLTTKQKLYFEPQAVTSDTATMVDTKVAAALTQQVEREERLNQKGYTLSEKATLQGAAYMRVGWNMTRGVPRTADMETGRTIYQGDNEITVHPQQDVIFDYTIEDFYALPYVILKTKKNRWDLVAMNPDLEAAILGLPSCNKVEDDPMTYSHPFGEDNVYVYELYAPSSPALPDGRLVIFSDKKTIFHDDANPYVNEKGAYIPLVQMKPEPIEGTGFGYPFFSNILPMQEMLDHNFSALASNNAALGVKTVLNPNGNDMTHTMIGDLRFINYKPMNLPGGGKPETLDLNTASPELYKFSQEIRGHMMEIYNINAALRGAPPPGVTAASAIATLTTNAIEFSQNFNKAYIEAMEMAMTYSIYNYRNFADIPMLVSALGPDNTSVAKEFVGSDLEPIKRVVITVANPLMATSAGKKEVASDLLKSGLIKNVRKYFRVLEGAPVRELYEDDEGQEGLIQKENDDLRNGKPVVTIIIDKHPEHIRGHYKLLDDPEIRRNGALVEQVMQHIYEHYQLSMQAPPDLMQMIETGQMPMMQPPPPGLPPAQGGPPVDMPPPIDAEMEEVEPADPANSMVDIDAMTGAMAPTL